MIEDKLIRMLSDESEKIDNEWVQSNLTYDTEICGWKDIQADALNIRKNVQPPATFRIRSTENKGILIRSSSSKSHLSTVSSNNESRSSSPNIDFPAPLKKIKDESQANKKRISSYTLCQNIEEVPIPIVVPSLCIKFHKPPRPRKQRKPIKVFRLPKANTGDEE